MSAGKIHELYRSGFPVESGLYFTEGREIVIECLYLEIGNNSSCREKRVLVNRVVAR